MKRCGALNNPTLSQTARRGLGKGFADAKAFNEGDKQEIVNCLYVIGGGRGANLTNQEEAIILQLANDEDPEVRETVAACIGLRVGMLELFPILFYRLKEVEKDSDVRMAIINAITHLAKGTDWLEDVSVLLSKIVLDEYDDDEVRGCAYAHLLYFLKKVTPADYAAMPWSLSEIDWDEELVKSLLHGV